MFRAAEAERSLFVTAYFSGFAFLFSRVSWTPKKIVKRERQACELKGQIKAETFERLCVGIYPSGAIVDCQVSKKVHCKEPDQKKTGHRHDDLSACHGP
jgi:hypothetical protein